MEQMKRELSRYRFDRKLFLSMSEPVDFDGSEKGFSRAIKNLDVEFNNTDYYAGITGARYYGCNYYNELRENNIHFIEEDFSDSIWKSKVTDAYWLKCVYVNNWARVTVSINPDETIHAFFTRTTGDKRQIRKQAVYDMIECWKEKGLVYERV